MIDKKCICGLPLAPGSNRKKQYCDICRIERGRQARSRYWRRQQSIKKYDERKPDGVNNDFFNMTLQQISETENVSRQRIDQICADAMRKFKIEFQKRYGAEIFEQIDQYKSTGAIYDETAMDIIDRLSAAPFGK